MLEKDQTMGVENEEIKVEYTGPSLPLSVQDFMPDIYLDGEQYYGVFASGKDQITGRGTSIEEAKNNCDAAYQAKKAG